MTPLGFALLIAALAVAMSEEPDDRGWMGGIVILLCLWQALA